MMRRWVAGALLVTVGWLASPDSVPVYDGVGTDQPYRYVGKSPAPSTATDTATVTGGVAENLQAKSDEVGPQVIVDLSQGAFSATTDKVTLTAAPFVADGTAPRGTFDGNAYHVTASDGATLMPDNVQGFLFVRAAVMTSPDPVVVHRTTSSDPWTEVKTVKSGRDVLATPFRALGDYAVIRLPGSKPIDQAGGLSGVRLAFLGGGVLLLIVITVLVLRRPRDEEP